MIVINNGKFENNGEVFNIYSGAMHYFRIPAEYWEDRLLKLKLAGFNTVETYVCWNLHEPSEGVFDFSGRLDIKKYIKTAEKLGLHVIVRPGPYICAEWDMGGLPAWLLADKNMRLRCYDLKYLAHIDNYYKRLIAEIGDEQCTRGGSVIAMQVENEYGSFGNDKKYLEYIRDLMLDCGVDVLLFTSDGPSAWMLSGGTIDGIYKTLNFGSGAGTKFKALDKYSQNAPKMCMEFWCGWFDHWGGKHHTRGYKDVLKEMELFFEQDASFNFYMFHGGTNFGFTAGANQYLKYSPTVTSYDYSALLNEYGDYTPAYHAVRELLCKKQNIPMLDLPASPKLQSIGTVMLNETTSLLDNLDNIGKTHFSPMPEGMEHYGQCSGMIYYKTTLAGNIGTSALSIKDIHDRAYVYVDGKLTKTFDFNKAGLLKKILKRDVMVMSSSEREREISVLVDAMGHVNYGEHIYDTKGIGAMMINMQTLMGYEVVTLPLDNIDKLDYSIESNTFPKFFKGQFYTSSDADCFVNMKGWTKGSVYVNGFNLGRFWKIGPQESLYLPGVLLHTDKPNEIVVLELEKCKSPSVEIVDIHTL